MGWADETEFKGGALSLGGSTVGGTLYLSSTSSREQSAIEAPIRLRSAECTRLCASAEVFTRTEVDLDSFVYQQLALISPEEFLLAIESRDDLRTQPYTQLARYCEKVGQLTTRRLTLVSMERRVTRQMPHMSAIRWTRLIYGAVAGYGYRAGRAFLWLALVITLSILLLADAGNFVAATANAQHVRLTVSESISLSLDQLLPFITLGTKDKWILDAQTPLQWALLTLFFTLKFAAWSLVALALASVTGLIRKAS